MKGKARRLLIRAGMVGGIAALSFVVAFANVTRPDSKDDIRQALEHATDADILSLYQKMDFAPLWYGNAPPAARENLYVELERRRYYGVPRDNKCTALAVVTQVSIDQQAAADVALTACLLRFRTDLAAGAAALESLGHAWFFAGEISAFSDADAADLRQGNIKAILSRAEPPAPDYGSLKQALAVYIDLESKGGWPRVDSSSEIALDAADNRFETLEHRLAIEGYLANPGMGAAALRDAVRRFQADHGLEVDGRVGKQTAAELNVSVDDRISQIAVNMERWRHVPRSFGPSYILVNAADATLKMVQEAQETAFMRTIVGDPKHPTPAFRATVSAITLNPSWTIPRSIATKEILPKLKRNPKYLLMNEIEILNRRDDPYGLALDWHRISPKGFAYQLRQRPGSKNPLGLIKFEMSNPYDVYLHDTPAKALFALPRRGLSHGCIRVQDPRNLALRLITDQSSEHLNEIIARGKTTTLPVPHPVPVYILYWTAFADESGRMNFREDLYDRDTPVAEALGYTRFITRPTARNDLIDNGNCALPS